MKHEKDVINPFINKYGPFSGKFIFRIVAAFMKFPLFIFLNVLHFIHYLVSEILYFSILKRYFIRLSSIILCSILRVIIGYLYVPISQKKVKKNDEDKQKNKKTIDSEFDLSEIKAGDIIICNYPSYFDLIYLQAKMTPIFFIPVDSTHVQMKRFHQIFFESFFNTNNKEENKRITSILNDKAIKIAKEVLRSPIILLPEQRKTNGTSLIAFNHFEANFENTKIYVMGINHKDESPLVEPNYVSGSLIKHFTLNIGVITHSVEVNFCDTSEIPNPKENEKWIEECQNIVSSLSSLPYYEEGKQKIHVD